MKSWHPRGQAAQLPSRLAAKPPSHKAAEPQTGTPNPRKITLLILYSLLILAGSFIPMDGSSKTFAIFMDLKPTIQNLLHIPIFALLSILLLQVLDGFGIQNRKKIIISMSALFVFGILNELLQILVPGRYPGIMDIALNILGALLGIWIFFHLVHKHQSNNIGVGVY